MYYYIKDSDMLPVEVREALARELADRLHCNYVTLTVHGNWNTIAFRLNTDGTNYMWAHLALSMATPFELNCIDINIRGTNE